MISGPTQEKIRDAYHGRDSSNKTTPNNKHTPERNEPKISPMSHIRAREINRKKVIADTPQSTESEPGPYALKAYGPGKFDIRVPITHDNSTATFVLPDGSTITQKNFLVSEGKGVIGVSQVDDGRPTADSPYPKIDAIVKESGTCLYKNHDFPIDDDLLRRIVESVPISKPTTSSIQPDTNPTQSSKQLDAFDLIDLIPVELRGYDFYKLFVATMDKKHKSSDRYRYFIEGKTQDGLSYTGFIAFLAYKNNGNSFNIVEFHKVLGYVKKRLRSRFATMKTGIYDDWFKLYCKLFITTHNDIMLLKEQGKLI